MKLAQYDTQAVQMEGLKSRAFGFQLNAKMYDIVINKLYQNKAGAVIRELFANAWDSHVAAGNTDTPIEIHMPSWLDQNFGIRDYGTGIPHDNFEDIYCNVGESTKEDSNEFIGAFGLGSKTPFTMTDTYIIENWHGGRKTTWLCFKSNGTPECSKVGDEPSDEPTGLQCSFSFDSKETVDEFKRELPKQLMFFPKKPDVSGMEVQWKVIPKHEPEDTYFFMDAGNMSRYNMVHYVVMGNVSYPFTQSQVGLDRDMSLNPLFESGKQVVLLAKLGDVDIPPSREQLELTDKTKKYISSSLADIMQTYVLEFVKDMGIQPNLLAAQKYVSNANVRMVNAYMKKNHEDMTFGDGTTHQWYDINYIYHPEGSYTIQKVYRRYKNILRATELNVNALVQAKFKWFVNDLQVGGTTHINANSDVLRAYATAPLGTPPEILVVKPQSSQNKKTFDADVKACVSYIEDKYGVTVELLSAAVGFPVKNTVKASGVAPDQVFTAKRYGYPDQGVRKYCENYTGAFPTEGYFLELKGWQFNHPTEDSLSSYSYNLKKVLDVVLERTNSKVYFVRAKSIKKLGKNVKPFADLVESLKAEVLKDIERDSYLAEVREVLDESYRGREKILKLSFPQAHRYMVLQRYLARLSKYPDSYSAALAAYKLIFGKFYDVKNHPTSTNAFVRDVPQGLAYLEHWYKHKASKAMGIIGGYGYHTRRAEGLEQLQELINPTNK